MAGNNQTQGWINQLEPKRQTQRINKTKSWFFMENQQGRQILAKLTKKNKDRIQRFAKPEMKRDA